MALFLSTSLIILISLLFMYFGKGRKKYPGPGILETVQGFLTMDGQIHLLLSRWAEKYGPFFAFFLGPMRHFVISDAKLMKELFQMNEYSDRPPIGALDPLFKGVTGLLNSNGKEGQAHRMFAITTLKSFGLGKREMSELLSEEISEFMNTLAGKNGEAICIKKMFIPTITNTLWISISSKRFTETDPTLKIFKEFLFRADKVGESLILAFWPSLTYYIPWIPIWRRFCEAYRELFQILENMIKEHEETRIISQPRDFIDAYLDKAQSTQDKNSYFYGGKNLVPVLIDFIIAGSDTMSLTMEWSILHMIRNLEVQEKVHEELKAVVGTDRLPTLEDRSKCIYTEATIFEILRLTPPVILSIPHCTTEDTTVSGKYFLPKNSIVLANLYAMNNNKEIWLDPEIFRPERWLSKNTDEDADVNPYLQLNKNNESLVNWSVGKRRCTGEALARDSVFLLFTSLMSRFKISCPPHQPAPSLKSQGTILCGPEKFSAIFTPIKT